MVENRRERGKGEDNTELTNRLLRELSMDIIYNIQARLLVFLSNADTILSLKNTLPSCERTNSFFLP